MFEIDLTKLEKKRVWVKDPSKKGGGYWSHRKVGKKEEKIKNIKYKSVHDYIQNATGLDVDMREGDKYITDSLMGRQIIVRDSDKNRLDVWIKGTPNMIQLSTIGAEKSVLE